MSSLVIASILSFIIIISIASVGGMITEKSGVVNLSIEGFMTIGAVVYAILTSQIDTFNNRWGFQWITMPLAGFVTALFSIIYSLSTVKLRANQTIAGIALNTLALTLSIFIVKFLSKDGGSLALNTRLWAVTKGDREPGMIFNIAFFMGITIIVFMVLWLGYTKFGKKIKAVGENPSAAASLGINVENTRIIAITISAFFVGIAGALFAQALTGFFYGSVQGIGFIAVAIVIFGQWKPLLIIGGAIIFGTLYGISNNIQLIPALGKLGSYKEIIDMVPYLVSLTILIFTSKKSRAPKAIGIPYVNQGR